MTQAASQNLPRLGVVCSEALRVEGLHAVLGESFELLQLTAPDTLKQDRLTMVLIDASEGDLFAMIAAFRRARPGMRLIVLSGKADAAFIQKVVGSGAKGFLSHTASPTEIRMAIDVVADGSIWAPRKVLASLIDTYAPSDPRPSRVRLTARERDVVQHLIDGRSNREIASLLGVEVKTVKAHVGNLLQKVGVPNRVALTVRALEMQLLTE